MSGAIPTDILLTVTDAEALALYIVLDRIDFTIYADNDKALGEYKTAVGVAVEALAISITDRLTADLSEDDDIDNGYHFSD